ncbi:MAG: hypothetical protein JRN15_13970 [Nitrososphaerota archaeon]|nr:hypothetical protein [Nitrososphaerota archaeon]
MSEELAGTSVQVTLKVPTAFLKEFDDITAQLGYPRNEAVREAMRRFVDFGYQKINERHPEKAMGLVQGMMSSIFGGIAQEMSKLESAQSGQKELPSSHFDSIPKSENVKNEARLKKNDASIPPK